MFFITHVMELLRFGVFQLPNFFFCSQKFQVFLTIAFPALTFFATAAAEIRQRSPSEELGEHGKKRGKVGKFCIISDSQN